MASDWIKMRTDLYRDPKVCIMAESLNAEDGDLSSYVNQNCQRDMTVTRNVMRNAVVGALVTVWGTLRHTGRRNGDDLVVKNATANVIDDIADLPGFGSAMLDVGWVVENEIGLVLPSFFNEHNAEPTATKTNAERQKAWRDRKKMGSEIPVTKSNDRNGREEKRREEKNKEEINAVSPNEQDFNPRPTPPPKPSEFNPIAEFSPETQESARRFWMAYCGQYHGKSPLRNLHSEQTHKELMHFAKAIDIYGDDAIAKLEAYYAKPPKEDRQIHAYGILSKLGLVKASLKPFSSSSEPSASEVSKRIAEIFEVK